MIARTAAMSPSRTLRRTVTRHRRSSIQEDAMTIDWWSETDGSILACLREVGAVSPAEIGRRLGISEGEATTFVCTLVAQGKVRIGLVELNDEEARASRPPKGTPASADADAMAWLDGCTVEGS
jgi:hypothetical protein